MVKGKSFALLVSGLILIFIFSLILSNINTKEALAADQIILSMAPGAFPPPPAGGLVTVIHDQMKLLEQRTNGKIKIEI